MPTITNKYLLNKRTELKHVKSGSVFMTDAPVDNNGKGERFSPTDTVSGALSACMMTIMANNAEKDGLELDGLTSSVTKIMAENPRRITEIIIEFDWEKCPANEKQRITLKRVALKCPVALSLHPDIKQTVTFNF